MQPPASWAHTSQPPVAETEQSYCSAATTNRVARGLQSQQTAGYQQRKFFTKRGDFNAILLVRASCVPSARGVGRTPLDGLKKMLDNKA